MLNICRCKADCLRCRPNYFESWKYVTISPKKILENFVSQNRKMAQNRQIKTIHLSTGHYCILPAKNRWYKKLRFLLSLHDTRNTSLYKAVLCESSVSENGWKKTETHTEISAILTFFFRIWACSQNRSIANTANF